MSEGVYGEAATGRVMHGLCGWAWPCAARHGNGRKHRDDADPGRILVLVMQRKGPMRLSEIARETALSAATTSDAVTTLESKGLVENVVRSTTAVRSRFA